MSAAQLTAFLEYRSPSYTSSWGGLHRPVSLWGQQVSPGSLVVISPELDSRDRQFLARVARWRGGWRLVVPGALAGAVLGAWAWIGSGTVAPALRGLFVIALMFFLGLTVGPRLVRVLTRPRRRRLAAGFRELERPSEACHDAALSLAWCESTGSDEEQVAQLWDELWRESGPETE